MVWFSFRVESPARSTAEMCTNTSLSPTAGNGAVMRNLPVVLATLHEEPAFEARSLAQARFTHNNALSDAATLICGRLLRRLLLALVDHRIAQFRLMACVFA